MVTIQRVIDNRVCLLGLDWMYREAMKRHERGELLECARCVADALQIAPADVPIEGYYVEDQELTEYFQLVRALQGVDRSRASVVSALPQFHRLQSVTSSPIFGRSQYATSLLPASRDPLADALVDTFPEWNVHLLTKTAASIAHAHNDFSLVGLAARARDAVLLAAARESVVLYADAAAMAARIRPTIEYVWQVDSDTASAAGRFVSEFNVICNESLPLPTPSNAEHYWHAHRANDILGRCVRLGFDDSTKPVRHYHWGIYTSPDGVLMVQEFWHTETWTTERYRTALNRGEACPCPR
ncbi:MAG: hypothetical protein IT365_29255 [Candidatus Hydrogenedentes bacterium]|nr:hypothetical protein [Candidatus Hydrogenedentota bacterium]